MSRVVVDLTIFQSDRRRTWPDLELKSGRSQSRIRSELVFGSQNNTSDETNGINNAVSCYTEAVQFSASFVTSQFSSFWRNLRNINEFCIFIVPSNKIVKTPLDRSAALVLSTIYWMHCSYTGIWQISLEIWPEQDLVRLLKNGRICQSRSLVTKQWDNITLLYAPKPGFRKTRFL